MTDFIPECEPDEAAFQLYERELAEDPYGHETWIAWGLFGLSVIFMIGISFVG